VKVVEDVVYHSRPTNVVYFVVASLERVVVQKRQNFPCNLQGIICTR
jgi:hypothetical protein